MYRKISLRLEWQYGKTYIRQRAERVPVGLESREQCRLDLREGGCSSSFSRPNKGYTIFYLRVIDLLIYPSSASSSGEVPLKRLYRK